MKRITVVKSCYSDCPFFGLDGGPGPVMVCNHPHWTEPYAGMIITRDNRNGIPEKCPLRLGAILTEVRLK